VATAETVRPAPGPLPAAGIEETEQIADWLEQPGVRLMHIDGDWAWPLHAVLDHESFVHHALGGAGPETSTDVVEDRRLEAVGPGGA
jgi:DNA polymerase-3 subunit epsilon